MYLDPFRSTVGRQSDRHLTDYRPTVGRQWYRSRVYPPSFGSGHLSADCQLVSSCCHSSLQTYRDVIFHQLLSLLPTKHIFHLHMKYHAVSKGGCYIGLLSVSSYSPFCLVLAFAWGGAASLMLWRFLPSPVLGKILLHLIYCIRLLLILVAHLKRLWASAHRLCPQTDDTR